MMPRFSALEPVPLGRASLWIAPTLLPDLCLDSDRLRQGFPDEFHLGTLEVLLGACPELQPGVRVHVVMASLMDRLSRFAAQDSAVAAQFDAVDAFGKLKRAALRVSGGSLDLIRTP